MSIFKGAPTNSDMQKQNITDSIPACDCKYYDTACFTVCHQQEFSRKGTLTTVQLNRHALTGKGATTSQSTPKILINCCYVLACSKKTKLQKSTCACKETCEENEANGDDP